MLSHKKISKTKNSVLSEAFIKSGYYPSREKIQELAKSIKTSPKKVENWLKYQRRKLYFNGQLAGVYKIRKSFSSKDLKYLNERFKEDDNPNLAECEIMSKKMKETTSPYQIKNWFSNTRRKNKISLTKNKLRTEQNSGKEKSTDSYNKKILREIKSSRRNLNIFSHSDSSLNENSKKKQNLNYNKITTSNGYNNENNNDSQENTITNVKSTNYSSAIDIQMFQKDYSIPKTFNHSIPNKFSSYAINKIPYQIPNNNAVLLKPNQCYFNVCGNMNSNRSFYYLFSFVFT